jgi:glycosyltransferase involved in cell wall biosynthesis
MALKYCAEVTEELALPISTRSLRGARVFHSPLSAPCEQVMRQKRLAKIVTVQDIIPIKFPQFFAGDSEAQGVREVLKAASSPGVWVHCVSEATKRDLLEYLPKLPPERVFVAYTGVRESLGGGLLPQPAEGVLTRYGLEAGQPYFLSVCTLEPRKNISRLIAAFQLLARERGADWPGRLVLAGGAGWLVDKVQEALDLYPEVREKILLTGFVPDEDLAVLYANARAFAFPSLYEGFGLPVIEAMRLGAPVITSNVSSMPEAAGGAALLVNPRSIEELAEALTRLENDAALRAEQVEKGKLWSAKFTPKACAEAVLDGYKRAVTDP